LSNLILAEVKVQGSMHRVDILPRRHVRQEELSYLCVLGAGAQEDESVVAHALVGYWRSPEVHT
jgi:hypothetical protein